MSSIRALLLLITLVASWSAFASTKHIEIEAFPNFDVSLPPILQQFKSETGISVTPVIRDYGTHHHSLLNQLVRQRAGGDVIVVDVEKVAALIASGGLLDLKAAYEAEQYEELFPPYAWAQAQGLDGGIYGIPLDLGPGVMYYRADLFKKAGVNVEQAIRSWEDYIAAGEKLKQIGVSLIASADDVAHTMIVTGVAKGEGVYFDSSGEPVVTSERFVKAFSIAKEIREKGLDADMHTLGWSAEWYAGFRKDRFATQLSGSWFLGHLKNWIAPEKHGLWRAAHLPNVIYGNWGGSFLVIPQKHSDEQHYDEAWRLIEYLAFNREVQLQSFDLIESFPANKSAYNDKVMKEPIGYLGGQPARLLFTDVVMNIEPVTPYPGDHIARSIVIDSALIDVLDNKKSIEQALLDADKLIRRRTARFKTGQHRD